MNVIDFSGGNEGRMKMFEQLVRAKIGENNFAVISMRNDGRVVIAQQSETIVNGKPRHMFAKGAFEMEPSVLLTMRQLIDEALRLIFENVDVDIEQLAQMREYLDQRIASEQKRASGG